MRPPAAGPTGRSPAGDEAPAELAAEVAAPDARPASRRRDRAGVHELSTAGEEVAAPGEAGGLPAGLEVLVVDDNRDAADSLSMLLELKGCRVATAYDGVEALAAAARQRPSAVVLDIAMPGMNGYEVAQRMRADPELASARIIALTGFGHDEARRRVREAGIDEHLVKPVDLERLMFLLGEVANGVPPASAR